MSGLNVLNEGVLAPITEYKEADTTLELNDRIKSIIESAPVVLFMKGNGDAPQCGFSFNSVNVLKSHSVPFNTFDILSSPDIRTGVKSYSNWPTFPQLYVKGELIGGNDIIVEMNKSGELKDLLENL